MENTIQPDSRISEYYYFDRDVSWLSFNERVLMEAANTQVPLLERINFLSIYSSNLDEFFRVRMPAVAASHQLYSEESIQNEEARKLAREVNAIVKKQQNNFGIILRSIIGQLKEKQIHIVYGEALPASITQRITDYFFSEVLGFLRFSRITTSNDAPFLENNTLYLVVTTVDKNKAEEVLVVNIPSDTLSRFLTIVSDGIQYVVFLDDIIKHNLSSFVDAEITGTYSLKVTRDAELNLENSYDEDIAERIELELGRRDKGAATRVLHEPGLPAETLNLLIHTFGLENSVIIEGGRYHNLKDLSALHINRPELKYEAWPAITHPVVEQGFLLDLISKQDMLIHTPYQSYLPILRFFNEASAISDVEHIYLTMYRVASDSRILNGLLSALKNGKKVTVLIELKARFDEGNNLKWAKQLKSAGAEIIYTKKDLKVHAKIALVQRTTGSTSNYVGLLATGNLNEGTARFYTDHVLLTGNQALLDEVKMLFNSFREEKGKSFTRIDFKYLVVARHNLHESFLAMIDREILHAQQNLPAKITLKLNNLEELSLINKLYEASNAGVKIDLIIRSICRLVPGIKGMSENITITRIVDRYLEHGRIYIFHNQGKNDILLGSADWMNRNIYKRIEVCFPLYDATLKQQIMDIVDLQLKDNIQAVRLDETLQNCPIKNDKEAVQSQRAIYGKLAGS